MWRSGQLTTEVPRERWIPVTCTSVEKRVRMAADVLYNKEGDQLSRSPGHAIDIQGMARQWRVGSGLNELSVERWGFSRLRL